MTRLRAALALSGALLLAGFVIYGQGHKAGVRATVTEYVEADQGGAEDVRETSRRVLRDLGHVDDPVGLLCATGGLRDAECGDD